MFVLIRREPLLDARQWPGRRPLAFIDATAWPVGVWVLIAQLPFNPGLVGQVLGGLLAWSAIRGVYRALCLNRRYRFITWRISVCAAPLLVVALALKLQPLLPS